MAITTMNWPTDATTSVTSQYFNITQTTATDTTYMPSSFWTGQVANNSYVWDPLRQIQQLSKIPIAADWAGLIDLPDGATLECDGKGSYKIEDQDAKIIYKANRIREFNRYMNASDILEGFIRFMGDLDVRQSEVLNLPIELFINFLILRAAQADDMPPPDDVAVLPPPRQLPRCFACGRFIRQDLVNAGINFCDDTHLVLFMHKRGLHDRPHR